MKQVLLVSVFVLWAHGAQVLGGQTRDAERVGRLLETITTETASVREKAFRDLLALRRNGVRETIQFLKGSDAGTTPTSAAKATAEPRKKIAKAGPERGKIEWRTADPVRTRQAGARFALHGMAMHVSRPGAEGERRAYVAILLDALRSNLPVEVKKFLIEQLQIAGRAEAVPVLARCLDDEALAESARQALEANPAEEAVAALRKALGGAKGTLRIGIIQALGARRDKQSVDLLIEEIRKSDLLPVRCAALIALGQIGDPRARPIIVQTEQSDSPTLRQAATEARLLLDKQ
ncbi:MAG: HEAT repeat domain-containing protein [Candidatus Sumerlaeia bacterium]|nr:HEAT repeat domain-containing protein [Candidatus Sumerlaeia bacterium]